MASLAAVQITSSNPGFDEAISIAFDGTNMWGINTAAADSGSNYSKALSKIDVSTFSFTSFPGPGLALAVCYDGAGSIWVTSQFHVSALIEKIRTSDGAILGTFSDVGDGAFFLIAAGGSIWISNELDGTVSKLKISDGSLEATVSLPANASPEQLIFDGTDVWTVDGGVVGGFNEIYKISPSGTLLASYPAGGSGFGLAFDGTNLWIGNYFANTLTKMSLAGTILATFPTDLGPTCVGFDGTYIWVANNGSQSVQVFDLSGSLIATSTSASMPQPVFYMAYDGTRMWMMPDLSAGPVIYTLTVSPGGVVAGTLTAFWAAGQVGGGTK